MNTPPPPDIVLPPPESPASKRVKREATGTKDGLDESDVQADADLKRVTEPEEDVPEEVEKGTVRRDTVMNG